MIFKPPLRIIAYIKHRYSATTTTVFFVVVVITT